MSNNIWNGARPVIINIAVVESNIIPSQNKVYSIGTSVLQWLKGWFNTLNVSSLSPNEAVVTDSSSNLVSLPYSTSSQTNSLVEYDSFGNLNGNTIVCSQLQQNSANLTITTNNSGSINILPASNTDSVNINTNLNSNINFCSGTSTGTINLGGTSATVNIASLTASTLVATNGSKNLTSLAYSSNATASTLAQYDSSSNLTVGTTLSASSGASLNLHAGDNSHSVIISTCNRISIGPSGTTIFVLTPNASGNSMTIAANNPSTSTTLTLADPGSNSDTFAYLGGSSQAFTAVQKFTDGLTFDGTNTLSNYVDKTGFTPSWSTSGGAPTGLASSIATGVYIRLGNSVRLWFSLSMTYTSGGSGAWMITGLPFTVNNTSNAVYNCSVITSGVSFDSGYTQVSIALNNNATTGNLIEIGSGKSSANVTFNTTNFPTGGFIIRGMLEYFL